MVVRRMATQRCTQPLAAADCGSDAPAAAPALPQPEPLAGLEADLAALEADIRAVEAAARAAQGPATAAPPAGDAASSADVAATVTAGQAQLARVPLAGLAIRAAELAQRLRDNPAGPPLQPRLAALADRLAMLDHAQEP